MKKSTIFTAILLLSLVNISLSYGATGERTREMHISGLDYYHGSSMTVLFVSAREAGFGMSGSRPRVRKVLSTLRNISINKNEISITVPSTFVPRNGFSAYNYIILVVHNMYNTKFIFKNLDGTIPLGQDIVDLNTEQFKHNEVFTLSKSNALNLGNPIKLKLNPREKFMNFDEE
jgi:hypothetical protein